MTTEGWVREREIAATFVRDCSQFMGPVSKRDLKRAEDEVTRVLVQLVKAQRARKRAAPPEGREGA